MHVPCPPCLAPLPKGKGGPHSFYAGPHHVTSSSRGRPNAPVSMALAIPAPSNAPHPFFACNLVRMDARAWFSCACLANKRTVHDLPFQEGHEMWAVPPRRHVTPRSGHQHVHLALCCYAKAYVAVPAPCGLRYSTLRQAAPLVSPQGRCTSSRRAPWRSSGNE